MKTLKEYILEAEEQKRAIGHFNISNLEGFWAVVNAAQKLNLPVIIGVSEGERDFIGIAQVKALVQSVREDGMPVFLNADHTYSVGRVKEVVDSTFDAVIIDGAGKSFDENVAMTKEAVEYAREHNPNMLVEAELGFIGTSSKVLDEVPEGMSKVTPEEARDFVRETQIDLFAPGVGNVHGIVKGGAEPKLDIDLIKEVKQAAGVPLVLHGASGNSDEEISQAIAAGISIVHVNTELRLAYKHGLQKALSDQPDEIAPYKYLRFARDEMQQLVEKKLTLFSGL